MPKRDAASPTIGVWARHRVPLTTWQYKGDKFVTRVQGLCAFRLAKFM